MLQQDQSKQMDSFGKEDTAKSWNNSTQAMKKNKQKEYSLAKLM